MSESDNVNTSSAPPGESENAVILDRAIRLFDFLIRIHQVRTKPARTVNTYVEQGGKVVWFHRMPDHPAIESAHRKAEPEPDEPFLLIDRIPRIDPPPPPASLTGWLEAETLRDPRNEPALLDEMVETTTSDFDEAVTTILRASDHPEIRAEFQSWLRDWQSWARVELENEPARILYATIFQISEQAAAAPEELEVLLGVGCLTWRPANHDEVQRQLIVIPADLKFDDETGRITVLPSADAEGPALELDMLNAALWPAPLRTNELKGQIRDFDSNLLSRDEVRVLLQRLANNLDPDGVYEETDTPKDYAPHPIVTFAPALILRRRSNQSLLRIYQEIQEQIRHAGEVPTGLRQLVSVVEEESQEGAAGTPASVGIYLPLSANKEQLRLVERVNSRTHTVVQGPPGTGKTHTIANLLSHLLAQGKRVLITAQTDRALRELRAKLPEPLEALCVSVVGRERSDLADLKVAVNTLAGRAEEFDPRSETDHIDELEGALDQLRRDRSRVQSQLIEAREKETIELEHDSYKGTLAQIAIQHREREATHGWLAAHVRNAEHAAPITGEEAVEWLALLRDEAITADEAEAKKDLIDPETIPSAEEFQVLLRTRSTANDAVGAHGESIGHAAYEAVAALEPKAREALRTRMHEIGETASELVARNEVWMSRALRDVFSGKPDLWQSTHDKIQELLPAAKSLLDHLGPNPRVQVATSSVEPLTVAAKLLKQHLDRGGKLKGLITPRAVKQASELLAKVRVNGLPPNTSDLIALFLDWVDLTRQLEDLEKLWPSDVPIPQEDTPFERWAWNQAEVRLLERVMGLAGTLRAEEQKLTELGVPKPDWANLEAVREFGRLIEAAAASEAALDAEKPISQLLDVLENATRSPDAASVVLHLREAVESGSEHAYRDSYVRLKQLRKVRERSSLRDEIQNRLDEVAPGLAETVIGDLNNDVWSEHLARFEASWDWLATAEWLERESSNTFDILQRQMVALDERIRQTLIDLTASRAWHQSVGRLGMKERQSLKSYALAVRQIGRGTGKYAPHKRREAQRALQACRSSVPAWVMPIYRIADTLKVEANMFDVVIIDEASQAGLESMFLQYLAPKVVVVGDDKQVSPSGVGLERQQLIDLRRQLLFDFEHGHTWENPETSLFDQARIRFPDLIALREHFRCVPEIIGFSNRIVYEPDRIPLIPLRQYGTDRLEPIKTIYVSDGYTTGGSSNRVNPAEADAVVDQVLKCCADPAYDGKTMGVISLTGRVQAQRIEQALLHQVDPREFHARQLRCGDAADFQGSERDVMFLSLVAANEPGLAALTRDLYVQRFNVAASRAKDQMWLFHSVKLAELTNREDMRYHLLNYCLGVERQVDEETLGGIGRVPEDVVVSPFDSLFEQHVYNRIFERGYTIVPQWQIYGYRVDLVVVGGERRIAVECDGDQWHGPDAYERDLIRQRELERCDWTFFRLRASAYYLNPAGSLEKLWQVLDEHDIRPRGWEPPAVAPAPGRSTDFAGAGQVFAADLPLEGKISLDTSDTLPSLSEEISLDPEEKVVDPSSSSLGETQPPVSMEVEIARESAPSTARMTRAAGLEPYSAWDAGISLPDPNVASVTDRITALTRIVEVEGPVLAHRAYTLFVNSARMRRVGKKIRHALNSAVTVAIRKGVFIGDNPLNESGNQPLTLRLPEQSPVILRQIGPRTFHEIPPAELAALIRKTRDSYPFDDKEEISRRVLETYGLKRLTQATWDRFQKSWDIS